MKIYARMNPDLWMTPVNSADRQLTAEGEVVGYMKNVPGQMILELVLGELWYTSISTLQKGHLNGVDGNFTSC